MPPIFVPQLSTSHVRGDVTRKGNSNGDWISYLLALGLSHLSLVAIDIDVTVWSRGISLLLTGLLILSSLSQILRSVSRVVKLTNKTAGASFLFLSLAQLFVSASAKNRAECSLCTSFHYWYNCAQRFLPRRIKSMALCSAAFLISTYSGDCSTLSFSSQRRAHVYTAMLSSRSVSPTIFRIETRTFEPK